ncbi:hypothetical protein [Guptibacillus hwajinpoensis]|nr:hypothetical protein [Alkalihalobacillus macyae]
MIDILVEKQARRAAATPLLKGRSTMRHATITDTPAHYSYFIMS